MTGTRPGSAIANSVIQQLEAVDEQLMPSDGVRYFNTLYLEVARAVSASQDQFEDLPALQRLEVEFVELYLAALQVGTAAAKCWRPLFESRMRRRILPIQFALAGMNAHINHDLPIALVQTWTALGIEPLNSGPFRRDFEVMNSLLAEVEGRMRPRFIPEEFQQVAERMERLGDLLAIWNIRTAREAAWANGLILWRLRDDEVMQKIHLAMLDRTFGIASRALLQRLW